jgi:N4-gp56 family major capsid protein
MGNSITIDALRQELWTKELFDDVARDNFFGREGYMGADANNIVQVKRDLMKKKGDIQTFGLVTRLNGFGVTGDSDLEGNEEAQLSYAEQVAIDQIRNAVRTTGKLDAQKVTYDQIAEAREQLKLWMQEYIEQQIFLKLGGVTNTSLTNVHGTVVGTRATWSNTPDYIPDADTAYTGNRYRYLNAAGATAASGGMSSSSVLTLDIVTKAAMKARLAEPRIQPIQRGGDSFYVMFVHPYCAKDLRTSSAWKTAQQDAQRRGEKNPVFRGALGYWSNVLLVEHEMVPWLDVSVALNSFRGTAAGTDFAVDTARNLLCGRQAAVMAEAKNPTGLVLEKFDYQNKDGVAASFIGGIQKAVFNSKEFGVIAVDAYAAE